MWNTVIHWMIYIGSALMVVNIYSFTGYARRFQAREKVPGGRWVLYLPISLLVAFLIGYIAVAMFGDPDLIVGGVLLGGSIFVYLVYLLLERITSRILESERLEAQLMAAEESSRAKSRFLSSMSHEMRTPLNAIIGLDELALRNPNLEPITRSQLERIDTSAHHLLDLINDVLDMSRIESGHLEIRREEFSLNALLNQVSATIRSQCEERGLTYSSEARAGLDEYYIGDPLKLRQVLINILGNSVKFTPAPGQVSMLVSPADAPEGVRRLRFILSDTGVGMDPEFIPHIFDLFSQEKAAGTTRHSGSGLGMAIARNIVIAMGGDIQIESEKGRGSVFTVEVNLEPSARRDEPAATGATGADVTPDQTSSLRGCRVLIAEDIDINAEILMDILELEGVESRRAENGREAVALFSQSPQGYFDAVLMDLRMPEMDGLDAARAIRALDREDAARVPIIALSANAFEDDVRQSREAGMDAHLAKPVELDKLRQTLKRLIKLDGIEGASQ